MTIIEPVKNCLLLEHSKQFNFVVISLTLIKEHIIVNKFEKIDFSNIPTIVNEDQL